MTQIKQVILLLVLLFRVLASTAPLNTCPTFEIQTVSIVQSTVGSNFATPIICNITLVNAQPANNYFAAVNYQSLSIPTTELTIEIDLIVAPSSSTNIVVYSKAPSSGRWMQILDIVYLIIPPAFNNDIYAFTLKDFVSSNSGVFDFSLATGSTTSLIKAYSGTISPGNYSVVGFINALNIKVIYDPNKSIGLSLNVVMINTTHFNILFTSQSEETVNLQGYRVTIIAYRIPSTYFGVKITTLTLRFPHSINDTSISPSNTFFGIKKYSFKNADLQFTIQSFNKSATQNFSVNMMAFISQIISFETSKCCLGTPFVDITNSNCTSFCPDRSYTGFDADNISMACYPCRYDCYTCQNDTTCTSCNNSTDFRQLNLLNLHCDPIKGYYDAGVAIALPCNFPKCCGYTPFVYNQGSSCVASCPSDFVANASNVCVRCNLGYWPVSGHCTNVIGCVAATASSGSVQCIFCRVADHFILQNQTCVCSQGYSLDTISGKCLQICGDSIHFKQECDDNNTEDGDGCSSTCKAESYFVCNNNSSYTPTECAYIGAISLSFNYANKTEGKNQAVFSFSFTAKHKQVKIDTAKIISSFNFTCGPHIIGVTMSTSSTEALLIVDYEEDLEGKFANVTFGLNPKVVLSTTSLSTSFLMVASKQKLVFFHTYPIIISLAKAVEVLALIALVVFLIISFVYRMMAVEMLHSFLLVYLLCLETSNPTQAYLVFKNLRILALNFKAAGNYYSQGSAFAYSFQDELNTKQILAFLLIAVLCCLLIEKVIRKCLKDSTGKLLPKYSKVLRVVRHVFRSVIFCLSIGYGYQVLMPSSLFKSSSQQAYKFYATTLVLFLTVCFSLLFFRQAGSLFCKIKTTSLFSLLQSNCYPSIYLFFWFILMIFQAANAIQKISCLQQISLSLISIYMTWFICVRPYSAAVHNVCQIILLLTDVLFLVWSTSRKYSQDFTDEYNEAYISLTIVVLMSAGILLSVFRTIHAIYQACQPSPETAQKINADANQQEQGVAAECRQIQNALTVKNKYLIRSMLLNDQLLEIKRHSQSIKNQHWKIEMMIALRQRYETKITQQFEYKMESKFLTGLDYAKFKKFKKR